MLPQRHPSRRAPVAPTPDAARQRLRHFRAVLTVGLVSAASLIGTNVAPGQAAPVWLDHINAYRTASGLPAVADNSVWSAEATAHSCYMLQHGIGHAEQPGLAGYTPGGNTAGLNGNVAVSGGIDDDPTFIDRWMSAPFHAIGLLRPNWTVTGYGRCSDSGAPAAHSAATLDVLRGLAGPAPVNEPVVFPGEGATVSMTTMSADWPDPVAMCGWSGPVGLPIVAQMPGTVSSGSATLTGPDGGVDTCVLHAGNVSHSYAASILSATNGVIVVPRSPLTNGTYHADLATDGGSRSWSFHIGTATFTDPQLTADTSPLGAPSRLTPEDPHRVVDTRIGLGATRLPARTRVAVPVADASAVAISANIVAVAPGSHGFLSAFDCGSDEPVVSTMGYRPGEVVANQTTVTVTNGKLCLYSLASVDVVIDLNGVYRQGSGARLSPSTPTRLFDSNQDLGGPLNANREQRIRVSPATDGTRAAVLNVTVVDPAAAGHTKVYPCDATNADSISSVNFAAGEVRANTVVTPLDDSGMVCVRSTSSAGIKVDLTGTLSDDAALELLPVAPIRLLDSRSTADAINMVTDAVRIAGGTVARIPVAGRRGVPADARAVTVNLTATGASEPTFLNAYGCGQLPPTSTVNIVPSQPSSSNGATVELSPEGDLCVFTLASSHVVVDLNAVWL